MSLLRTKKSHICSTCYTISVQGPYAGPNGIASSCNFRAACETRSPSCANIYGAIPLLMFIHHETCLCQYQLARILSRQHVSKKIERQRGNKYIFNSSERSLLVCLRDEMREGLLRPPKRPRTVMTGMSQIIGSQLEVSRTDHRHVTNTWPENQNGCSPPSALRRLSLSAEH